VTRGTTRWSTWCPSRTRRPADVDTSAAMRAWTCTQLASSTLPSHRSLLISGIYQWGLGDGSPTISEMGSSFFLPENDSLCIRIHSVTTRREGENMGVGFFQFTWGLDATGSDTVTKLWETETSCYGNGSKSLTSPSSVIGQSIMFTWWYLHTSWSNMRFFRHWHI